MSRPLPFSPRDGREDNRESNKTKSPPSPGTMAGPGQDKGRPDTSGHKRPSVKKNWEGCFMALRMDILVKPDPSHPQFYCQFTEKKRARIQERIQISSCPSVRHLKDYHQILRRIIIHGISCWWKKAFPVMCLFSEIDRVLCFMRKRTLGQDIGGVTGERESSETL